MRVLMRLNQNNNKGVYMSTFNFSMSVVDNLGSTHAIVAIGKGKDRYEISLTLDNGKVVSFDERLVFVEKLIPTEDLYVVVITRE